MSALGDLMGAMFGWGAIGGAAGPIGMAIQNLPVYKVAPGTGTGGSDTGSGPGSISDQINKAVQVGNVGANGPTVDESRKASVLASAVAGTTALAVPISGSAKQASTGTITAPTNSTSVFANIFDKQPTSVQTQIAAKPLVPTPTPSTMTPNLPKLPQEEMAPTVSDRRAKTNIKNANRDLQSFLNHMRKS